MENTRGLKYPPTRDHQPNNNELYLNCNFAHKSKAKTHVPAQAPLFRWRHCWHHHLSFFVALSVFFLVFIWRPCGKLCWRQSLHFAAPHHSPLLFQRLEGEGLCSSFYLPFWSCYMPPTTCFKIYRFYKNHIFFHACTLGLGGSNKLIS